LSSLAWDRKNQPQQSGIMFLDLWVGFVGTMILLKAGQVR
jgi:hypothetical protein